MPSSIISSIYPAFLPSEVDIEIHIRWPSN